jgi:hypothetical protein
LRRDFGEVVAIDVELVAQLFESAYR